MVIRLPRPRKQRINTQFNARLSDEELKRANEQSKKARKRNIEGRLQAASQKPRWEGLKVLAVPAGRFLTAAEIEGIKQNNSKRRAGTRS